MKKIIVLGAMAAGVVAVLAAGIVNRDKVGQWVRHYYYRGRSTAARATNIRTDPLNDVEAAKQCRQNLRMLERAKRKAEQQRGITAGTLSFKDLAAELPGGRMPVCPSRGEYVIGEVGMMPKCTIGSNKTVRSEDDHLVINY